MKFHMKKNKLRIFSFLLALLMVVNSVLMPTFADVETFVETLAQETTETESQIDEQENNENESVSEAESESVSEAESESVSEVESESASEVESESVSEAESESASEAESESASEVESEFASEAESESPSEASPSNAEKVCESCGIDPCECKNTLKMGVLKLAGKNASAFNLAAIWENAENATYESYGDEYKIGFIDSEIESFMVFGDTISTEVKITESPEYFILKGEYVSNEDGSVLMYEIDSADDDFFFSVLVNQWNNYVEADVFYDVVDVSGLYATVKDSEEITLWADLSVATDTYTVEAGTLSEEYLVEAMAYEAVGESGEWFVKLEQNEDWPEDADGYVWMRAACIAELSEEKSNVEEGISAIVNGQTIVVSGDAVPEGAKLEVSVPEINGEALPGVFDIKIFDENGDEWQPIDDEATVTVSIPVEGVEDGEYVDVHHFIDHSGAIDENMTYVSIDGADEVVLEILDGAISASDREGYVVVEKLEGIKASNGVVRIESDSFSVYVLNAQNKFEDTQITSQIVRFNNKNGNGTVHRYYASKGTTFEIETTDIVFWASSDTFSVMTDGVRETNGVGTTVQNAQVKQTKDGWLATHGAEVTVPDTAAAGETILVRFGTIQNQIYLLITVIQEVTVSYESRLNITGVTVDNIPSKSDQIPTDGDDEKYLYTIPTGTENIPVASNENYTFLGWNTSPAGDGKMYAYDKENGIFVPASFTPKDSMTLYAMWETQECTVSFDYNNGTDTIKSQIVKYDTPIIMPEGPTRADYKFKGWSATKDGKNKIYQQGDTMQVLADVTMYAVWGVDLTITVSGGTVVLQKGDETVPKSLNEHGFSSKTEDGATTYSIEVIEGYFQNAKLKFEATEGENNPTITYAYTGAVSEENFVKSAGRCDVNISETGIDRDTTITITALPKCIVSFESNYGSAVSSIMVDKGGTINSLPTDVTRTGYKFEGWYKDSSLTDGPYTSLANITSNITLYAKWSAQSYKVVWKVDNEEILEKDYVYGTTIIPPTAPSKNGYTFIGWNGYTEGMKMGDEDETFTAAWEINTYTIIYKLNGGSMPEGKSNPESYTCETETFTLNNPERIGYIFIGWTGTGLSNATTEVKVVKGSTGAREYTATWTENTVVISYLAGENGSVRLKTSSLLDESVEETIEVWTGEAEGTVAVADSGYKFVGWYEGEKLVSTQEIWAPTKNDDGMWEPASYTAKFERALADLTITVASRADDSSFVFYISGTPDDTSYGYISLDVVLAGRDSITIKDLPVGTYLVHEKSKWSWRLVDVDDKSTDLKSVNTVAFDFTNVARKNLWLNGYSYGLAKFVNGGNS